MWSKLGLWNWDPSDHVPSEQVPGWFTVRVLKTWFLQNVLLLLKHFLYLAFLIIGQLFQATCFLSVLLVLKHVVSLPETFFLLLPYLICPVFTVNYLILIALSYKCVDLQLPTSVPLLGVIVATSFIASVTLCWKYLFSLELPEDANSSCRSSFLCAQHLVHALVQDKCSITINCLLEWIHAMFVHQNHVK